MEKDISDVILGGHIDINKNAHTKHDALEILEHFGEKEKERGIVILIGGHHALGMHTAHLLATTLTNDHIIFAQTNKIDAVLLDTMMIEQRPEPTMENLIKQISDDLVRQATVMKDYSISYKDLLEEDIAHKKEQEKRRRRHLHTKKVSSKKKG